MKILGLLLTPFAHPKVKGGIKCHPQRLFAKTVFFDSQWQKQLAGDFSQCWSIVSHFQP